jgi:hypothetical protein
MLGYAIAAGVEWVALTDSNEYHVYNSHAAVPVEQKLFRRVVVADPATKPADTLALLSKEQMAEHLIDELWKAHFVDRQVRATLESLFGPEPDQSLVRLIRSRVPTLSPRDVRAGLGRLRTTFDFPGAPLIPAPGGSPPTSASVQQRPPAQPRPPVQPRPAPVKSADGAIAESPRASPERSTIYLVTPVKDEKEASVRETLESLLGQGVYVFSDRATGRDKIQAGDRICFYHSGVGVVADAEITSAAERRGVLFAKDAANYPWAFTVRDVRYYFDSPVVIDAALRYQLDAFVNRGHDPNGPWSWLVQGTRYVTAHDFALLTRTRS